MVVALMGEQACLLQQAIEKNLFFWFDRFGLGWVGRNNKQSNKPTKSAIASTKRPVNDVRGRIRQKKPGKGNRGPPGWGINRSVGWLVSILLLPPDPPSLTFLPTLSPSLLLPSLPHLAQIRKRVETRGKMLIVSAAVS